MAPLGAEVPDADEPGDLPRWVPAAARNYLAHTEKRQGIRELARESQVAPSTISRQVRRMESQRDDPLVDSALRTLTARERADEAALEREAMPALRRLTEAGTVLAVAREMEKGVLVREAPGIEPTRFGTVERRLAEAMALRDWIVCAVPDARVQRYRITTGGRNLVRQHLETLRPWGLADAAAGFGRAEAEDPHLRHMRSALAESPLQILGRRRDIGGRPFLTRELVVVGERLREDFEIVQEERDVAPPNWERWLRRVPRLEEVRRVPGTGAAAALSRIERALADLGPGLADVALRCCCLLEGLEQVERRNGWSARSGKVVLRIALERLCQHYQDEEALIG